jgi:CSLREA domain-containing protein
MNLRRRAALALLTGLFALALPAVASAQVVIDSTADEPDAVAGGVCDTAAGDCTLRAAIEVANAAGTAQEVVFDNSFNAELGDMIALTSPLPPIKAPISLAACITGPELKPCAEVNGPAGNFGISVEANGVTISGLSITGALIGIDVINESQDFTATGNWIGVELDGSAGPNRTGIFIGPGSDGATIGGSNAGERNVTSGNEDEGLDIEGASNAVIRGNYFGVAPDGTTQMANGTNIELTDSTVGGGFAAEDNEIGAPIKGAPVISEACDGGCNVISGAEKGINLNGFLAAEAPASGPTLIHGNYIGLDAAGQSTIGNSTDGIAAAEADRVTVGGLAPNETNYFAGGGAAVIGAESVKVLGNAVGIAPDGSDLTPPHEVGVLVGGPGGSEEPLIEDNEIRMSGGIGIEDFFATGGVVDNHLEGGSIGIQTFAGPGGGLIAGNEIESPTDYGILVDTSDTEVRANMITDSAGAGIGVTNSFGVATDGGLIGGNTAEKENVIEGSAGAAIEIFEEALEPGSVIEIARNRGSGNGGLFIDLKAGANEGIVSPVFSSAVQSQAEGAAAEPNARIRVFRKASGEMGELQSFLGEAVADGSGNWIVSYPSVPVGTIVAATQTNADGATSELSMATTGADPSNGGDREEKKPTGIDDPVCAFTAGKCRWPETWITAGPKGKIHATTVKFRFIADMPSTFQCKLDKGQFKNCRSPKTCKKLKPGKHVFKVRATGDDGKVGKVAKRKFTVLA